MPDHYWLILFERRAPDKAPFTALRDGVTLYSGPAEEAAIAAILDDQQQRGNHATTGATRRKIVRNGDTEDSRLDLSLYACEDCRRYMNPAERYAAMVCGHCVRKRHRKVTGR